MTVRQRPEGGKSMNKYELTVVVSAKLDDEGRAAELEKVKALVEKFGGTIANIDDAGKKKLAYEIQKHITTSLLLILITQTLQAE